MPGMRLFRTRRLAVVMAATLALGTGAAVAPVAMQAAHASCSTAGCNLGAGDDNYAYINPGDVAGFSSLATNTADITDASTFSFYTDSSGTLNDIWGSGVFGTGTSGCTDMKAFQTAGGGTWALITNFDGTWDQSVAETILASSTLRSTLASNVATEITTAQCSNGFKFDGAELDFENLKSTDRTGLNALIDSLATDLHNDSKLLAVSVYSKSSDQPAGFGTQDAQDWAHITSKADLMNVQGYGYCWDGGCLTPPGSTPGPIGPEFWDKAAMDYAVTALGSTVVGTQVNFIMPLYGIDWPGSGTGTDVTYSSDAATTTNANGVKNDVTDIIAHYGGSASFETTDGSGNTVDSPYYNYSDTFGPVRKSGRFRPPPPSGVSHGVWFTNATMVGDLITGVAAVDGVNGIGFWRLGAEPPVWSTVEADW